MEIFAVEIFKIFYFTLFIYLFLKFILFLNLHNCISFAKYQNESTTGIHVFQFSFQSQRKAMLQNV